MIGSMILFVIILQYGQNKILTITYTKMERLGLIDIMKCETPALSLAFLLVFDVFLIRTWMHQTLIGSLVMNLLYVAVLVFWCRSCIQDLFHMDSK
jgi:hypothetical protein